MVTSSASRSLANPRLVSVRVDRFAIPLPQEDGREGHLGHLTAYLVTRVRLFAVDKPYRCGWVL